MVGSPRSGTTVLEDMLEAHPHIATWYEPYFVLDRYFRDAPDDTRTADDATDRVKRHARTEFAYYRRKRGCPVLVDKSPRNSLKIPFLREVFPRAKYIHLVRDGRDTVLSMYNKWLAIERAVDSKDLRMQMEEARRFFSRQPLWRHKWRAFLYENGGDMRAAAVNILLWRLSNLQRIQAWEGRTAWGPQFAGWRDVIDEVPLIEFNARQWRACVEGVLSSRGNLEADDAYLQVRYEDLLAEPERELSRICAFVGAESTRLRWEHIPRLRRDNCGKWRERMDDKTKQRVGPVLQPLLEQLEYADDDSWFR